MTTTDASPPAAEQRPVRVLIVDDSAMIRHLLSAILSADPEIQVVGTAEDPIVARQKIKTEKPDVLTLDVEMPRMNGLAFLELLMRLRPMPVVMVSTLMQPGAEATREALALGAADCVAKPTERLSESFDSLKLEICTKVKKAATSPARLRVSLGKSLISSK